MEDLLDQIIEGDCLEVMQRIPDGSVDMILADLPYGTTACHWDSRIPLEPLWTQYKRVIKPRGAIVLTASQPFTSVLVMSNLQWFRYEWMWEKNRGSNFQFLRTQPMKEHEAVLVFYDQAPTYNPQRIARSEGGKSRTKYAYGKRKTDAGLAYDWKPTERRPYQEEERDWRCPRSVLPFNCEVGLHPTQKPVALFEYLIHTYTNPGEVVLDNVIGSGTTAVACINTGRHFIGIEKDSKYVAIARERVDKARTQVRLTV